MMMLRMTWILLAFLFHALIGALLVRRCMRGMLIRATLSEWIMMVLGWPFFLNLFRYLDLVQAQLNALEVWAADEEKESSP
jgi:hypothetical protein